MEKKSLRRKTKAISKKPNNPFETIIFKIKNVVDLFSLKQDLDLKQVIQEDLDLDGIIMVQVLDKMKPEKSMNDLQFKDWLKLIRQIKMIKSNIDPNKIIHDKWMRLAIVRYIFILYIDYV